MKRFLPLLIVTSLYSQWFSVAGCNNDGDLDGNGELEILDIIAIQNLILEAGYSEIADANTDGELSVTDLIHAFNWYENDSYPCFQRFIFDNDTLDADVGGPYSDQNGDHLIDNILNSHKILKINNEGYPIDTLSIGDTLDATSIIEHDGVGYIIGGKTSLGPTSAGYKGFIVKTDYDGNHIWYQTPPTTEYFVNQIIRTFDGGVVAIGSKTSHYDYIFWSKFDILGNQEWSNSYHIDNSTSNLLSIIQRPDSGFVLFTADSNLGRVRVIKLSDTGTMEEEFFLAGGQYLGFGGVFYNNNNYYLNLDDVYNNWMIKFDEDFNYISHFDIGFYASVNFHSWRYGPYKKIILNNNLFTAVGDVINAQFLSSDYIYKQFTLDGELVNYSTLEMIGSQYGRSLSPTNDGGYFIAIEGFGHIKTDATGQVPVWLLDD